MKYLGILIWFLLSLFSLKVYPQNPIKNTDNRYVTDSRYVNEPIKDFFLDEFNDFNEIKSVKIKRYTANSKMKIIRNTGEPLIIIENRYPYIYKYIISSYNPLDTVTTYVFKYHNNTLEYAKLSYLEPDFDQDEYKKLEKITVWNYNEDGNISSKEDFIDNRLTNSKYWIYNNKKQLIRVNHIINYKEKPSSRCFFHYIYNQSNQLIERIIIIDDEIHELKRWGYTKEGAYYELNQVVPKCRYYSDDERLFQIKEDDFKYIYDKHKNWIKEIYQINDESFSVTEREIIYK